MGLLWHGHWRWNRPPSTHKHSTTLPALCTAGRDDTRGTGLYWVLLRLLWKSGQCSGKAQPVRQQRKAGQWNTGRFADAEGLCRPLCCMWMSWDETWLPLSFCPIKLSELSIAREQQLKRRKHRPSTLKLCWGPRDPAASRMGSKTYSQLDTSRLNIIVWDLLHMIIMILMMNTTLDLWHVSDVSQNLFITSVWDHKCEQVSTDVLSGSVRL